MDRRVVLTGIGLVTPLGVGKAEFRDALWRGETGIREISAFSTDGLKSHLGAEVRNFEPRDFIALKTLRKMDRLSAMTTASVRMALDDAGLAVTDANRDRIGIVMGTAFGNTDLKVQNARVLFTEGPGRVSPIHVPNTVMNAPAGHASIELGFRGVNTTINHQAISGEAAIAYGAMEVRRGAADVILAGGADLLSPFFYETLCRFRALSPVDNGEEAARPYDLRRNGPVMGEGCGIVCLEAGEHALARGAAPYCELAGWGLAASPAPPTGWPDSPRGLFIALCRALEMAGVAPAGAGSARPDGGSRDGRRRSEGDAPAEIDCIQGAGNGGRDPDALETEAFRDLFGGEGGMPLITSLKGATGEIFASGGIRAAALALSIREGVVPPVAGLEAPMLPLPFVTGEARRRPVRRALLSGLSFGGTYAGLVFRAV
jgi:3-oxoacyl-[acyl-carrier-protein] synthase II